MNQEMNREPQLAKVDNSGAGGIEALSLGQYLIAYVKLKNIWDMFQPHIESNEKSRLVLSVRRFQFSAPAPASKNRKYALYIKLYEPDVNRFNYVGKFHHFGECRGIVKEYFQYPLTEELHQDLLDIQAMTLEDLKKETRDFGHRYGICSCCGRLLTNPESIEAGIGPICASKWGF